MTTPFISDKVYDLVHSTQTVTSVLAASPPTESVETVAEKLYGLSPKRGRNFKVGERRPTKEDLNRVVECGKFGTSRPSDLFLQVCAFLLALCVIFLEFLFCLGRYMVKC